MHIASLKGESRDCVQYRVPFFIFRQIQVSSWQLKIHMQLLTGDNVVAHAHCANVWLLKSYE